MFVRFFHIPILAFEASRLTSSDSWLSRIQMVLIDRTGDLGAAALNGALDCAGPRHLHDYDHCIRVFTVATAAKPFLV